MVRTISWILTAFILQTSLSGRLEASAPAAVSNALEDIPYEAAWGQTGSLWDGTAFFFANGLRHEQAETQMTELKTDPAWGRLNQQFRIFRQIASSA